MTASKLAPAIVAETRERARYIADVLGFGEDAWLFDTKNPDHFEGVRTDRVLIDDDTEVPQDFMENIYGTATKLYGGQVCRVSVDRIA
ncbi:hypothetical protein SEA_JACKSPARROW_11 [Mycobacterium phage JackSparrow]|nr:hypothetical protein SEA_JACKSPARROW_11 [Mycobacterium phage JackSparrow]